MARRNSHARRQEFAECPFTPYIAATARLLWRPAGVVGSRATAQPRCCRRSAHPPASPRSRQYVRGRCELALEGVCIQSWEKWRQNGRMGEEDAGCATQIVSQVLAAGGVGEVRVGCVTPFAPRVASTRPRPPVSPVRRAIPEPTYRAVICCFCRTQCYFAVPSLLPTTTPPRGNWRDARALFRDAGVWSGFAGMCSSAHHALLCAMNTAGR